MTTEKNKALIETTDEKPKESFKLVIWLSFGFIVTFVLGYLGFLVYVSWPISEWSVSKAASLGDSFGILSSLFSGLAFAGLIVTIVMQNKTLKAQMEELELARKEYKRQGDELAGQKEVMNKQFESIQVQQFETTFFKIIEFHRIAIESKVFDFDEGKVNGYEFIEMLFERDIKNFNRLEYLVSNHVSFFKFYVNSVVSIFSYINESGKGIEGVDAFFTERFLKILYQIESFF